ncbi:MULTISPECIES: hypothetical protein [Myxococcus]|nr:MULTISPECIES: hypothetical protein [Myxococcus]WAM28218.1 hypothetical protein OZ403_08830 [Myxococcus sp. NMCA1]
MKRVMWEVMLGGSCALLVACSAEEVTEQGTGMTTYAIQVSIPLETDPCGVVTATASVQGPVRDIGPVSLEVMNDAIHGAIMDVPVGLQHQVFVKAYNSSGLAVYSGVSTVDVNQGGGGMGSANIFIYSSLENCPAGGTEGIRIHGRLESVTIDAVGSAAMLAPHLIR